MAVRFTVFLIGIVALIAGCRTADHVRDVEYAQVNDAVHQACHAPAPAYDAVSPVFSYWEGPHAVEEYVQFALAQNPEIHAARKRMEAAAYQVPVAASLQDPMLNVTVEPEPVQTAAGEQRFILAANQKFPWHGKLAARASVAEARTNMARAQLAAAELATIADVKRAYYQLYFIQKSLEITRDEQRLLGEIRQVALSRYKTGAVSQQDVLRADLEISNIENQLIGLRQQLTSAQARLARLLHVSPQSNLLAMKRLPPEQAPRDLDWLQRQAVAARPELHAQLAAIERDQLAVELAQLDYKPDVTLGFSYINVADEGVAMSANGQDALLLTAGMNLPIYKKRLNASVRSAEAQAVSTARGYDALRDGTLADVTDLFAQAHSQQEMLTLFREDILPKARQTLEVSAKAYNVGEVDFLQLVDNFRQVLRFEINYRQLEASLRQTLAELERVVGGFSEASFESLPAPDPVLEPLPLP